MTQKPEPPGLFVTGTDTEIGKTYVAAMIARKLRATGVRVGVYKPAASGCRRVDGGLVADDAVQLWEAAGRPGTLNDVCPQQFEAALAPHLAAASEGRAIDSQQLRGGVEYWRERSDFVLVEGAGGLMSPITNEEFVVQLATDLGYPLVLVSPDVLGTIHHTLATLLVAETLGEGLPVAGIVLNRCRESGDDRSPETNRSEIEKHATAPVLTTVGYRATDFDSDVDWYALGAAESTDVSGTKRDR